MLEHEERHLLAALRKADEWRAKYEATQAFYADLHERCAHCVTPQKPLMVSYRLGSVGDARRPGHDAPLPGPGWVAEKDR